MKKRTFWILIIVAVAILFGLIGVLAWPISEYKVSFATMWKAITLGVLLGMLFERYLLNYLANNNPYKTNDGNNLS